MVTIVEGHLTDKRQAVDKGGHGYCILPTISYGRCDFCPLYDGFMSCISFKHDLNTIEPLGLPIMVIRWWVS